VDGGDVLVFSLEAFNPSMKSNPAPLILLTAALMTDSPTRAAPLTANDADNGHTIELKVGQALVLTLGSNPTTGYGWVFDDQSTQIVAREGKPTYTADMPGRGLVGSGGVERWTFRAVKPGTETLRLDYRRPWEQNLTPASRVEFPVVVK
jgi:inhibitor of cysteine peptidase